MRLYGPQCPETDAILGAILAGYKGLRVRGGEVVYLVQNSEALKDEVMRHFKVKECMNPVASLKASK